MVKLETTYTLLLELASDVINITIEFVRIHRLSCFQGPLCTVQNIIPCFDCVRWLLNINIRYTSSTLLFFLLCHWTKHRPTSVELSAKLSIFSIPLVFLSGDFPETRCFSIHVYLFDCFL